MRCQRQMPVKDSDLQAKGERYHIAITKSKVFANPEATALANKLGEVVGRHKVACDDARFFDRMKVAAKVVIAEQLKATLKRVIHYIEAMASDEELKELQQDGIDLVKPKAKKRKSTVVPATN
ncbi:MAG TPA: hypothetical protein VJ550_03175 [Geomonas sp.]|nr:hypothetical protein [Geomonas sp.]